MSEHRRLVNSPQGLITFQAAGEGPKVAVQAKPGNDLPELFLGCPRMDVTAVHDGAPLQQIPVAGKQDAPLSDRKRRNLSVPVIVAIKGVETSDAQQAGQLLRSGLAFPRIHGPEGVFNRDYQGAL